MGAEQFDKVNVKLLQKRFFISKNILNQKNNPHKQRIKLYPQTFQQFPLAA